MLSLHVFVCGFHNTCIHTYAHTHTYMISLFTGAFFSFSKSHTLCIVCFENMEENTEFLSFSNEAGWKDVKFIKVQS